MNFLTFVTFGVVGIVGYHFGYAIGAHRTLTYFQRKLDEELKILEAKNNQPSS